MSDAKVIALHSHSSQLVEEASTAKRLVCSIRHGDADAENELVERYSRGLKFLLTRRIGDDERARDLLQETFCIAIEKLRGTDLDNPERLAGYLRGIAVRVAFNAGRRRQREPVAIDTEVLAAVRDERPNQFSTLSSAETTAAVRQLLDGMTVERDRELLTRFYVYDEDKAVICQALGLDSLHFNRVLFRAKRRFRRLLEEKSDGDVLSPIS